MKKFLYMVLALGTVVMVSCEKEEIGGTATQDMAGQWYVTADAVDAEGNVVYEDLFGVGEFLSISFNTSKNVPDEMWVSDLGNFWEYQVKVVNHPESLSFATADWADNESYESKVRITGGKIMPGMALTPSGMPADSIVYYVEFDDDSYPETYGYAKYKISGYRYTGLAADD